MYRTTVRQKRGQNCLQWSRIRTLYRVNPGLSGATATLYYALCTLGAVTKSGIYSNAVDRSVSDSNFLQCSCHPRGILQEISAIQFTLHSDYSPQDFYEALYHVKAKASAGEVSCGATVYLTKFFKDVR